MSAQGCEGCNGFGLVDCDCKGGRIPCESCEGEGTRECDECGHERECQVCDGEGGEKCPKCNGRQQAACPTCHGFGDVAEGAAWSARLAAEHTPPKILSGLLLLAERLDAGGLPRFRLDETPFRPGGARTEIAVEIAKVDVVGIESLRRMGFKKSKVEPHETRTHMQRFEWTSRPFGLPDRRQNLPGDR